MDNSYIKAEIEAITNGEHRTWGQISQLLLEIENSNYLQEEFSWRRQQRLEKGSRPQSLTAWVKSFSKGSGINISTLWRYLSAGRYYKQLVSLDCIKKQSNSSLPLDQLSDNVSAESLEILSKISRVSPDNEFIALAQKLLDGNVTRSELRDVWEAFRPVLDGQTVRGQAYRPLISAPDEIKLRPNYFEALASNALLASNGILVDAVGPKNHKVFFNIAPKCHNSNKIHEFNAVVAVKTKDMNVVLHGIEIITEISCEYSELISTGTLLSDFLWLIPQEDILTAIEELIPKYVGILIVTGTELSVIRPAQKCNNSGTQVECLAKALLAKLL